MNADRTLPASCANNGASRSGIGDIELRELIFSNEWLFRPFAGASILISGATGWFGVWLLDAFCVADELLGLNLQIHAVSRDPDRFISRFPGFKNLPCVRWQKADVRHFESADEFTYIIHAAADTSSASSSEAQRYLFDSIVEGTRQILVAAGAECKGFLLLSSGAIYDEGASVNAYAAGKIAAERLGAVACEQGVPVQIARCFAFVGPHMPFHEHFAIGNFIADAVHGRPICVKGDGRPLRSYLYMTDLVRALLAILTQGSVGTAYNVGSDVPITIEQLARCVDRVVGGRGVVVQGVTSESRNHYIPDTTRLRKELKFESEISLETAIARTAAWYRARSTQSQSMFQGET
jgi:dTDP-glucose 4,6-dehydratase